MSVVEYEPQATPVVRYTILAVLLLALHYVAARQVDIFNIRPNVMLLVAIASSIVMPLRRAIAVAFLCGLGADLFTTIPFGTSAIPFMIGAGVTQLIVRNTRTAPIIHALVVFISSFVVILSYVLISRFVGEYSGTTGHVLWVATVVSLFNAIVAPVALLIARSVGKQNKAAASGRLNW